MIDESLLYEPLNLSPRDPNVQSDMRAAFRQHSMQKYYVLGPGIVSATTAMPTRETMIQCAMSIATHTPVRNALGHSELGPASFWSREQAERAVDALGIAFAECEEFAAPF